ncbi:hypothetical protein LVB87_04170 [Lysobacter sp. KIS68-7]|uniref:hypothetical protein n=1 Tax=Lysobacter sp. KIS68-7 TaxID=2904252 RepID=UPI001E3BBE49|nr:hypothetical protein [Lysobacter sp. KIS68-7]UHQ20365.1 hypothetical protein LVB87_04170 [Lysobacter sp. KIS68-7]
MAPRTSLLLAGIALAGGVAVAHAAQTTHAERQAAADAMAKNKDNAIAAQPRTMAQADATQFRTKRGGTGVRVATQLWSTLGVAKDAKGNAHMTEGDGTAPTTPAEAPHE